MAEQTKKRRHLLPNFNNISEQVAESMNNTAAILSKSVVGTKKFGERLDVVIDNSKKLGSATSILLDSVNLVSSKLSIKSFIQIKKGMFFLSKISFEPLITFLQQFYGISTVSKKVKEENDPKDTQLTVTDIFKSIIEITNPKTIIKMSIGAKMLSKIKWNNIKVALDNILSITDSFKEKDIIQKEKESIALISIVNNFQKLLGAAITLSLIAIPGVVIIPPGMFLTKLIVKCILGIMKDLGQLNREEEKKITAARNLILAIGGTFALFTLTLMTIAIAVTDPKIFIGLGALTLLIGASIGLLYILSNDKLQKVTKDGQLTILAIGATFTLFALTILLVGEAAMDKKTWSGIGALGTLIAGSILILLTLNFAKSIVREGGLTLLAIGGAFVAFALVTLIISKIVLESNAADAFMMLAAVIGISVITLSILSGISGNLILGAAALAIVGGALLVFTAVIAIINKIEITKETWIAFGMLSSIIAIASGAIFGLSFAGPSLILGAAALALVSGALLAFSTVLLFLTKNLNNIDNKAVTTFILGDNNMVGLKQVVKSFADLSKDVSMKDIRRSKRMINKIANSLNSIIPILQEISKSNISFDKIDEFIGTYDKDDAKKTGLIGFIGRYMTLSEHTADMKKVRRTKRMLMKVGDSLKSITQAMKDISEIKVDFKVVSENTVSIVTALINAFKTVANDEEVKLLLKPGGGSKALTRRIIDLSKGISNVLADLATGVRDMANLQVTEYDVNGKVKGKRSLTETDFVVAGENVVKIVTAFIKTLNENTKDDTVKSMLNGRLEKTTAWKIIQVAKDMGSALGGLAGDIALFATGQFKDSEGKIVSVDFNKAGENISKLLTSALGTINSIDISKNKNTSLKDTADSISSLTSAVNRVDLTKIEKMNTLLTTLKSFTTGVNVSFDNLAKVINNNLVETLEKLRDILEQTNGTLEGMNPTSSATTVVTEQPVTTMTGQLIPDNNTQSNKSITTPDNSTITQIQQIINEINSSIKSITRDSQSGGLGVKLLNSEDLQFGIR